MSNSANPPSIVVDGGAAFFKHPVLTEREKEAAKRNAEGIAEAIGHMNIKAMGIAPYDLALGPQFLKQLAEANGLPLLSMNLFPETGDEPLFTPYLITRVGTLEVAILGLTGKLPDNMHPLGFHRIPWQNILNKYLSQVEPKADMIILLSSEDKKTNEQIAQKFKNIHIIVQSGQHENSQPPLNINNTLLCQTAGRGKYLGRLEIEWNETKTWKQKGPRKLQKEQNHLDRINWQIGRLKKRIPAEELEQNEKFQYFMKTKAEVEKKIQELVQADDGVLEECEYKNTFIAMQDSLPEDRTIKAVVDQTKREVNKLYRKNYINRVQKQRAKNKETNTEAMAETMEGMAGWQACKQCHEKQVDFFLTTNHSTAWQTLVAKDQQYNPNCALCHVTLPTYDLKKVRDENLLANISPELRGVGCEACHGPSLNHTKAPENLLPGKPDQSVCLQCHTDERDANFIFSDKVKIIRCPAG